MKFGIGKLRHLITVQQPTEGRGADGSIVPTWSTYAIIHGSVSPLIGNEYFSSQAVQAGVTHRVRIRPLSDITPKMRLYWDGRYFDINSIIDVEERGREMVLMCTESI
jgi:SPP1 family predicted phage head-tail adaptor